MAVLAPRRRLLWLCVKTQNAHGQCFAQSRAVIDTRIPRIRHHGIAIRQILCTTSDAKLRLAVVSYTVRACIHNSKSCNWIRIPIYIFSSMWSSAWVHLTSTKANKNNSCKQSARFCEGMPNKHHSYRRSTLNVWRHCKSNSSWRGTWLPMGLH